MLFKLLGAPFTLPGAGMKFIFNQLADLADQELDDESVLREDLLLLQVQYEEGDIDDDEYAEREAALMVRLREAAIASRSNKPIGDKMIMSAAFLVGRDQAATFDQKVQEIAQRYEGKLSFRYTGPWPPWNFVTIRLQLERSAVV